LANAAPAAATVAVEITPAAAAAEAAAAAAASLGANGAAVFGHAPALLGPPRGVRRRRRRRVGCVRRGAPSPLRRVVRRARLGVLEGRVRGGDALEVGLGAAGPVRVGRFGGGLVAGLERGGVALAGAPAAEDTQ